MILTRLQRAKRLLRAARDWATTANRPKRAAVIQTAIDAVPGPAKPKPIHDDPNGLRAVNRAAAQSVGGPQFGTGECQKQVHLAFGVPSDGTPTAAADWQRSLHKHHVTDPMAFPNGVPIAWTGGSSGAGHRAISAWNKPGWCWSTDSVRPPSHPSEIRNGFFDLIPIAQVNEQWPGHTLVGWTNDCDGQIVTHEGMLP
jgi:hypothetical protein